MAALVDGDPAGGAAAVCAAVEPEAKRLDGVAASLQAACDGGERVDALERYDGREPKTGAVGRRRDGLVEGTVERLVEVRGADVGREAAACDGGGRLVL